MTRYDVLGVGSAAIDDIIYIRGIPPTDGKVAIVARSREFGGLIATALAAAARLGATCHFAGLLGNDPDSIAVVRDLRRAGVVVPRRPICADARPVTSTIVASVDRGTRALYFQTSPITGTPPAISERAVRSARVLLVDDYVVSRALSATQIARSINIPVVADFESLDKEGFPRLLQFVDHLILSAHFARELTGTRGTTAPLRALWNNARKVVAITDGERGCWVATSDCGRVEHVPAYNVTPVDTNGCGDVFHGAYAAALSFGYPILRAIQFASVAAALKAAHRGTRLGLPSRAEVEARL